MPTEAAGLPRSAATREQAATPSRPLTATASLNALQSLLDYVAKLVVGLLIVPIMLSGLGRTLFGVWEMLHKLVGYLAAADGRPTQALRLVVAHGRTSADPESHRRQVGGAVVVWFLFLPLFATVGGVVIWLAPHITRVPENLHSTVRAACGLLVGGLVFGTLAAIPESVLRGMNLGYRRMGLQAGLSLCGGIFTAAAVYAGLGLVGVAAAQVALGVLTGACFWLLVRKYVVWFGVSRPRSTEVRALFGMSVWLAAGDLIAKLLLASDVLILGMVVSAAAVTSYVLTGYAARLAVNLHVLSTDGAMPGLAGVIGEGDYERAADVREELLALTWIFATVAGSTILLWNRSFLNLWVGAENYAGFWPNVLVVVIALQTCFIRADAYILDAALRPRSRVQVGACAAALTLLSGFVLTRSYGVVGLCLGVLAGRSIQTVVYPLLVRESLRQPSAWRPRSVLRAGIVTVLLYLGAARLGESVLAPNWLTWAGGVSLSGAVLLGLASLAGLSGESRAAVVRRVRAIVAGRRGRVGRPS
jgi:O-antigen/teichoic acid export membrane protein